MISDLVSAVITTYKREPAILIRALESILNQTYKNLEVIVVDDSPSDYPFRKDVSNAIQNKVNQGFNVRYIPHMNNMGACAARNTGMLAAKGTYIAFLDDDDEWMPSKIEKQMKVIKDTNVALVYCGWLYQQDNDEVSEYIKTKYVRGMVFNKLLYENFIASTSFPLIDLNCLKKVGGFDVLMQSAQDYDVWLRLAKDYEIDYVEEPLVVYHYHTGEQISSNPVKKINGLERINQKYHTYIGKDNKLWWMRHIVIAPYYAMAGNKRKALHIWLSCVKKRPGNIIDNIRFLRIILSASKKEING